MPDVDRLLNAIETAEAESYGFEGSDGTLSEERALAIDYYYGKNTFPAPEGQSQVISRDLFDTVEWILPSLTRIFANTDEVVKVEPIGPDDIQRAEQESIYLNHTVTQKNNWGQIFHDWAWDSLVTKNAYCLAFYDDAKEVEYETYSRQSEEAMTMLLDEPGIEVLEHEEFPDEDAQKQIEKMLPQLQAQYQQQALMAQQQGIPIPEFQPPPVPMLHSLKIRRTRENGKVGIRVLPPERCVIHQRTPDYTLKECDFFEYWEETTISNLRKMGFEVEDDIDSDERGYTNSQEDEARDRFGEDISRGEAWEPSMRKVRARMVWIRHDYDNDGIAELQYCIVVGKNILFREECNRIPVASIVAVPVPHRHVGVSIADVVMDIQETKTQMLRQGIDNLFHANNPRLFINEDKINLDDALVSRPGGVVRGKQGEQAIFGQDIGPIVIPNVFPQAIQGMEYMDAIKENRTGTSRYFTGTDQNALNKTASGIAQLSSAAAQRVEQIARMIAPSVEYLFQCVHELILKHGHKKEVIRIKGQFIEVDPSQWKGKRDLKIAVGLGSGSKEAVIAQLMTIFQAQMSTLPMGITDPDLIYNTLSELTKAAGFASEGLFWKKPQPMPQQPPPEIVKEQMKIQHEGQQKEIDRQMEAQKATLDAGIEKMRMEFEAQQKEMDRWMEIQRAKLQEGTKLAIAEMNRSTAIETTQANQQFEAQKLGATFDREDMKAQQEREKIQEKDDGMSELLGNLQSALTALAGAINRPRIAVRDPKTNKPLYGRPMTDEEMQNLPQ